MASEPATRQQDSDSASESDGPAVARRSPLLASSNQWQQRNLASGGLDVSKNMTTMQEFSEEHCHRERRIQEMQQRE